LLENKKNGRKRTARGGSGSPSISEKGQPSHKKKKNQKRKTALAGGEKAKIVEKGKTEKIKLKDY